MFSEYVHNSIRINNSSNKKKISENSAYIRTIFTDYTKAIKCYFGIDDSKLRPEIHTAQSNLIDLKSVC